MENSRFEKCKYSFLDYESINNQVNFKYFCHKKNSYIENENACIDCVDFNSRFIEYPITVSKIDTKSFLEEGLYDKHIGKFVKIKPCAEEYKDKTFIGIFLGELPIAPRITHNNDTKILSIRTIQNPAIFVPEIKKIIYGNESWWSFIEDLSDDIITKEDIENTWYIKLLKKFSPEK